jgi:serine/threonine protein kinase/tetratricopeptide (TPR) repeat protein/DNA-binding MarR family transcriptional regulator
MQLFTLAMSPGRPSSSEHLTQQARVLELIYEAETTTSGRGTSLAALARHLGTSNHDASETVVGLVRRGEVVQDPSSGDYRLTANGRLEVARRFTLIPPSPSSKQSPLRAADEGATLPAQSPDDHTTVIANRPQRESADEQKTIVGPSEEADATTTVVGGDRRERSEGTTSPLRIGQRFGTRYRITKLLGVGGMGAVYEAWDEELGVSVALKVIRPEMAGESRDARDLERRFKRELLLARQVTHKNVVRIHDLGEINGIKYITMPYIEGSDLGSILRTKRRLPIPDALAILRQALSGLVAAHAAGIVHRDLKPANIMVDTEGQALLMDFGIARSIGLPADQIHQGTSRSAPGSFGETMVGAVVGTIQYMAPEQAKGQDLDHRADIYAFGLIFRDALLGARRQEGAPTALAELQKRLDAAPESLRTFDATIPEPLDRIITRCLSPAPAARYQTARELEADLNRLDEHGQLIPIKRVVGLPLAFAIAFLVLGASSGIWWYLRPPPPPVAHDPVSVVIADFQNNTGDATFDRTLEPMLKRALEGASFISAYDRNVIGPTLGVRLPEKLDEVAAREIAVKQGLGVVLSGSVDRQGGGYGISVKASQTVTGDVIARATGRASTKEQVLGEATKLVTTVRKALGDETKESAQLFAMASLSATSLDVVRLYAAAQDAASKGRFDEARQQALKAVELDPKFGVGYQLLAVASRNMGQLQDAEAYIKQALQFLDGMTERERYTTRGFFYRVTGDYQQCVKEYGELVTRFASDVVGHNQRALCLTQLKDMRGAVNEMRQVVQLLPNRAIFRVNLALYLSYASDFQAGEKEARAIQEAGPLPVLALSFAQVGQGQLPQALESYQKLDAINALGKTFAASGLGEIAAYEGRFSDAIRILEQGAAADLTAKGADRAAAKFASVAHLQVLLGQKGAAIASAEKALTNSKDAKIRFLAARTFVEVGETAKAQPLIAGLSSEFPVAPRAYAKIVEGQIALKDKDTLHAIKSLQEANALLDSWIGHFDLGRAYLEAGQAPQADSEFDACMKRRGEALWLFADEEATYSYLPPLFYYQGRVREALNNAGFADSYRAYLNIRGQSKEDPLLPEIRRRIGT